MADGKIAKIARALISVSDKTGVVELARGLSTAGLEILSTGGTARALAAAGVPVTEVGDFTGAPEILDGRVKTLHPRIHGGILGRATAAHRSEMQAAGIVPIDLVVVNLYPFRETVARGAPFDEIIENIDIGGPTMIRSAAKNHERVAVVVDPADYAAVLAEIDAGGEISEATRFRLARKAFAHTAAYDGAIASHLGRFTAPDAPPADFPASLYVGGTLARALRYGENPHQKAAFYALDGAPTGPSLARARVLQGKELSYNNLLDLDAALRICAEFAAPAATIVKHNNPCGAAISDKGVADAYRRARETDPVSAFGGIVAVNRPVDGELAREIKETFLECVIAPAFAADALPVLAASKNLRLLVCDIAPEGRRARSSCAASPADSWCRRAIRDTAAAAGGEGRVEAPADARRAARSRFRVARLQTRQVERDRVRRRRPHAGHRRRPDVARRFGPHRGVEGARAAGRVGRRVGRLLPVPRRRRRGRQGGRRRRHPARRLGARRRIDRRRRRARPGDGVDRRAPLQALGAVGMRVLLVGSGGREHALAWKLGQSPLCEKIVAAPGNPGIAGEAKVTCIPVGADATDELVAAAVAERADLVVCGPEVPLAAGLGDTMRAAGLAVLRARRAPRRRSRARRRSRSG